MARPEGWEGWEGWAVWAALEVWGGWVACLGSLQLLERMPVPMLRLPSRSRICLHLKHLHLLNLEARPQPRVLRRATRRPVIPLQTPLQGCCGPVWVRELVPALVLEQGRERAAIPLQASIRRCCLVVLVVLVVLADSAVRLRRGIPDRQKRSMLLSWDSSMLW